jgi:hypothetical protein
MYSVSAFIGRQTLNSIVGHLPAQSARGPDWVFVLYLALA